MGIFDFSVGRKKPTPGQVAKERLKVLLVHDRLKVNPELLSIIKEEILTVVSQRLDIDADHMDVRLNSDGRDEFLLSHMPIKRQRVAFEWDPPSHTSEADLLTGKITLQDEE